LWKFTGLQVTKAGLRVTKAGLRVAKAGLRVAKAGLRVAKAGLRVANLIFDIAFRDYQEINYPILWGSIGVNLTCKLCPTRN
jgi:hypothetical protein